MTEQEKLEALLWRLDCISGNISQDLAKVNDPDCFKKKLSIMGIPGTLNLIKRDAYSLSFFAEKVQEHYQSQGIEEPQKAIQFLEEKKGKSDGTFLYG